MLSPKIHKLKMVKEENLDLENQMKDVWRIKNAFSLPAQPERSLWKEVQQQYSLKVPCGKNDLIVMEGLAKLAKEHGLYDLSFDPITGIKKASHRPFKSPISTSELGGNGPIGNLKDLFIAASFKCRYSDLGDLLFSLRNFPQIVKLDKMSIQKEDDLIKVDMILRFFYRDKENDEY